MRTLPFLLFLILAVALAGFIGVLAYFTFSPRQAVPSENLVKKTPSPITPPARPVISSQDPVRGDPNAPVAIIEFGDFFCPACVEIEPTLQKMLAEYNGKVKLVWKDLPNTRQHPLAQKAAQAARCAGEQGKFWEYHDLLLKHQTALTELSFAQFARELNLDGNRYAECLSSKRSNELVTRSFNEGLLLRVDATPYFFIGSRRVSGAPQEQVLKEAVENAYATR